MPENKEKYLLKGTRGYSIALFQSEYKTIYEEFFADPRENDEEAKKRVQEDKSLYNTELFKLVK